MKLGFLLKKKSPADQHLYQVDRRKSGMSTYITEEEEHLEKNKEHGQDQSY